MQSKEDESCFSGLFIITFLLTAIQNENNLQKAKTNKRKISYIQNGSYIAEPFSSIRG